MRITQCLRSVCSTCTTLHRDTRLMSTLFSLVLCKRHAHNLLASVLINSSSPFSLSIMSRLALPICLNYLYMIQVVTLEYHDEDDTVPQTAFAYVSGTIYYSKNKRTLVLLLIIDNTENNKEHKFNLSFIYIHRPLVIQTSFHGSPAISTTSTLC